MFNNPFFILSFFILLWSLNGLSSWIYLKKVNKQIIHLKRKYTGIQGYMGAVVEKTSFLRKVMMIMVTDKNGRVIDCEYLYGFTNFAKFKVKDEVLDKNISEISHLDHGKFKKVVESCINKINEQMDLQAEAK